MSLCVLSYTLKKKYDFIALIYKFMEDAISLMRGTQEFQKNLATTKTNESTVSKY